MLNRYRDKVKAGCERARSYSYVMGGHGASVSRGALASQSLRRRIGDPQRSARGREADANAYRSWGVAARTINENTCLGWDLA